MHELGAAAEDSETEYQGWEGGENGAEAGK